MAKARKCDLCEGYYDSYNCTRECVKIRNGIYNAIILVSLQDNDVFNYDKAIDICPGCRNELENLFNHLRKKGTDDDI